MILYAETFIFVKYLFNFSAIECRLCISAVTFRHLEVVVNGNIELPVMHS